MLLGVDVGGTFTDAVLCGDGLLVTAKSPTTPADQSLGVMAAIDAVLARAGRTAADVTAFAHGMTVATNALLEGRAARTALVATAGFTDLVALGRQARADLYRLDVAHPAPLVPSELRFGVAERMTPDGPLLPLTEAAAAETAARVADQAPEAVAVVFLHAYRHPAHELLMRDALAAVLPDTHISLSHETVGTFREYERAATTEIDAALSPLVGRYLRRLARRAQAAGLPEPSIMQSNGGLIDLDAAAGHAAWTVLSGPAGGAEGAAHAASAAGVDRALCFDMGGTSCDVCVVSDGDVAERGDGSIAGRPIALPTLDVHTVGAGGGSIAWRDAGGALRVGPQSAGSRPGPACYGRGGTLPTVTDANLVLGYLPPDAPLAGAVPLDLSAAAAAIARLAADLGLEPIACAEGIVRVANAEMTRALRVMTVERGSDPRDHALVAFGGAGPLHAVSIAEELGITRVLAPRASGVLAAFGLVVAPRRRDAQRTVLDRGGSQTEREIAAAVDALGRQARDALGCPTADLAVTYELRYQGQAFELAVDGPTDATPAQLREAFASLHEERYGHREPGRPIELVTVRVRAVAAGAGSVRITPPSPPVPTYAHRVARFGGEAVTTTVIRGALPPGTEVVGPTICELPETTLVVPPGWSGTVDAAGAVELRRGRR